MIDPSVGQLQRRGAALIDSGSVDVDFSDDKLYAGDILADYDRASISSRLEPLDTPEQKAA